MKQKNRKYIFDMVLIALFIALKIVLERTMSYKAWNQTIGFSFVAVAAAAVIIGTPAAMIVAGLGDLLGALLFPIGAYFPGFTLTAVLMAFCTGYFIHKNQSVIRILLSVVINQLFGSALLNSLWISILYGSDYSALVLTRLIQAAIMIPIQILTVYFLFGNKGALKSVQKMYNKLHS